MNLRVLQSRDKSTIQDIPSEIEESFSIESDNNPSQTIQLTMKNFVLLIFSQLSSRTSSQIIWYLFQSQFRFKILQKNNNFDYKMYFDTYQYISLIFQTILPIIFMPTVLYKYMQKSIFQKSQRFVNIALVFLIYDLVILNYEYSDHSIFFIALIIHIILELVLLINKLYTFLYLLQLYAIKQLSDKSIFYIMLFLETTKFQVDGLLILKIQDDGDDITKNNTVLIIIVNIILIILSNLINFFIIDNKLVPNNKNELFDQFKNIIKKKYSSMQAIFFAYILLNNNFFLENSIFFCDFLDLNQTDLHIWINYSGAIFQIFKIISAICFFSFILKSIRKIDQLSLILANYNIINMVLIFVCLFNKNNGFYIILISISGIQIGILFVLTYKLMLQRCEERVELFSWILIINQQLSEYKQYSELVKEAENIYILTGILVIGVLFILTVVPWHKNAYHDEIDPDLLQINLDETVERFGLTKTQFNSRYKFNELIKSSQYCRVCKYDDKLDQKQVAVKIISTSDEKFYEKQKHQLETLMQLNDIPNIMGIEKYVLVQEDIHTFQSFLIMNLAQNTLADQISERHDDKEYFKQDEINKLFYQLINALTNIKKKRNLQHRDIKPSNILYYQKQWYIADFGVSQIVQKQKKNKREGFILVGTQEYMDPELRTLLELSNSNQELNYFQFDYFKNDVFSLGLTLLEACTLESVKNCNVIPQKLDGCLKQLVLSGRYNDTTTYILSRMLVWNQNQRPHFEEISQLLDFQNQF